MPWPVTVAKGLASLFKRKKPKVNRRLTPEEIAEREAKEQEEVLGEYMRYKYSSPLRNIAPKQKEALAMAKTHIRKMDLPAGEKGVFLEEIQSMLHQVPPAAYESIPTAQIVKAVFKKMGLPIGATAGFIGGAKMEGLAREGKLPDWMTKEEFRSPEGAIGEALEATGMGAGAGALGALLGPTGAEGLTEVTQEFDEPDFEPGLEEGSIGDLLLWNRLLGD